MCVLFCFSFDFLVVVLACVCVCVFSCRPRKILSPNKIQDNVLRVDLSGSIGTTSSYSSSS